MSFFLSKDGIFPLYRGHRLWGEYSRNQLLSAAQGGGKYLIQSVQPDGRFIYFYDPIKDAHDNRYNISRHAGAVYAMLELYEVTRDPELLQAARKALDYLAGFFKPLNINNEETKRYQITIRMMGQASR